MNPMTVLSVMGFVIQCLLQCEAGQSKLNNVEVLKGFRPSFKKL